MALIFAVPNNDNKANVRRRDEEEDGSTLIVFGKVKRREVSARKIAFAITENQRSPERPGK